jgi:hypothetical protein
MKTLSAILSGRTRTLSVMTAHRAKLLGLNPTRHYGYVLRIEPPIVTVSTHSDIEGVGYWPHRPKTSTQHFYGWYKFKSDAENRAEDLARA